ncbi:MAG: 4-hydroxy-tetrahydrodipicolinate synthase, partial [Bacteroidia bacterium]|nr:4-hydroxy-tetrahydrodipicolinate synthase [Bacteroidia bacterium]
MKELIGTGVALVTPFMDDLTVDHEALKRIVKFNIENGVDYLVISGTTGESVTITKQEKKDIIATIKKENNAKVPLVLGIGGNNTSQVIEEIRSTDLDGISAILSVSPYYSKPTQEGLYQHFKAISKSCPIPIILYNVPGRTSKNMEPSTTLRLAKDFKNIIAVKEAGNNVAQYLELLKNKPKDFLIISGDDDLALGVVLSGGSGVISVIGQAFPKEFSKMIKLGLQGNAKESYNLHFRLLEITSLIFSENNPAGIKGVLEALGMCTDKVRLPLVP